MKRKQASLIDYLEVIVAWRKFIIRNVLIITLAAVVISFLLIKKYTATATMLPPSPEQNVMLSLLTGGLPGGMSSIPGIGAVLPGFTTPSDLYAAIMKSNRIRREVIDKHDLHKVFKTRKNYQTYEILEEITQITVSPEGIISVAVTYRDKKLAADIANTFITELDKFNNETAMTAGRKYRVFIEERLRESADSLAIAEEALRSFQEKHRTIALDGVLRRDVIAFSLKVPGRTAGPERMLEALTRPAAELDPRSGTDRPSGLGQLIQDHLAGSGSNRNGLHNARRGQMLANGVAPKAREMKPLISRYRR